MFRVFRSQFFLMLFADQLLMLLAWFILQHRVQSQALAESQAAAAEVPELRGEIEGMQGQLDDAHKALTNAREQGYKYRSLIEGKDEQIGMYQSTIKNLKGQISEIEKHFRAGPPVTLLVMIDVTQSMEQLITDLLEALGILFETLPHTSKDFRVGIIAFRDGVAEELPIMQVKPKYEDKGATQQKVLQFVGSLRVQTSHVTYLPVFERAAAMLKTAHPTIDLKRKVRMILISDTGCGENDDQLGYTAAEHNLKNYLLRSVQSWASKGDRGVAALYAESENSSREGADQAISKQWFVDLGSVSPKSASYTNANYLLRAVLRASLD